MKSETIVNRLKRRLERHGIKRVSKVSNFLLTSLKNEDSYIYLNNISNPCAETVQVLELRNQLIETGLFVITTDSSEHKWKLYPTAQFIHIYKQYREARNMEAPTRQEMQDSLYMLRSEVEAKLHNLARNIIEKLDPPFTEEKYQQYTKETSSDNDWD